MPDDQPPLPGPPPVRRLITRIRPGVDIPQQAGVRGTSQPNQPVTLVRPLISTTGTARPISPILPTSTSPAIQLRPRARHPIPGARMVAVQARAPPAQPLSVAVPVQGFQRLAVRPLTASVGPPRPVSAVRRTLMRPAALDQGRGLLPARLFLQPAVTVPAHRIRHTRAPLTVAGPAVPPPQAVLIDLGGCRQAWFGFYSSIRLGAWKPIVNIDMSATAFYVAMPLVDFVTNILNKRNKNDLTCGLNDRDRIILDREIRTLKVTMTHLISTRQFRIEGLSLKSANVESFEYSGEMITVAQYFKVRYGITLEHPNLPCIHVGKRNTFVPMEVCTLAPGQHCRKKLNEIQTSNMIRQTALAPNIRFERISRSVGELKRSLAQFTREFDMVVDTEPLQVEARILKPPTITYGGNRKQMPRDGEWKCDVFLKPAVLARWALAILGRIGPDKPKQIIDSFQREGSKLGMKINQPVYVFKYGPQASPRAVLEDIKNKYPDIEMTLVVLDPRSDYGALKAEAETTDLCMRTQCVKNHKIDTKFSPNFAVNLLQKINTKMGGRNNGILAAGMPKTFLQPFMAIGVDVNHPGPGDSTPSIAAMVASMDPVLAQYYACTSVQLNAKSRRSEYVVETESMFLECLTAFQKKNKVLPCHIYIFRDGVSLAEFDAVRIYELGAIRKACLQIRSDYTPIMTFIVVKKRHHVRFMPAGGERSYGRSGNIPAGTVVDSKIVNPGIFDFYLCSHKGLQGTSRPAHYHVVHDDADHSQDEIYKICFSFCHTYARCPRSVSIPAPVYYAHLAALRAKEHIKGRVYQSGGYADSNSGSFRSSSSSEHDLDKFQGAQKVTSQMKGSMYFV